MKFLTQFLTLEWWICVFIVGILINIISAYLKPPFDKSLKKFALWWSTRTEAKKLARLERVRELVGKPHAQIMARIELSDMRNGCHTIIFIGIIAAAFPILLAAALHSTDWIFTVGEMCGIGIAIMGINSHIHCYFRISEITEAAEIDKNLKAFREEKVGQIST